MVDWGVVTVTETPVDCTVTVEPKLDVTEILELSLSVLVVVDARVVLLAVVTRVVGSGVEVTVGSTEMVEVVEVCSLVVSGIEVVVNGRQQEQVSSQPTVQQTLSAELQPDGIRRQPGPTSQVANVQGSTKLNKNKARIFDRSNV